jgi:hypothetical protein
LGKKDFNTIGHIGSEVDRRAQSVLTVEKQKDDTVIWKHKYLRSSGGIKPINVSFNNGLGIYEKNEFF